MLAMILTEIGKMVVYENLIKAFRGRVGGWGWKWVEESQQVAY